MIPGKCLSIVLTSALLAGTAMGRAAAEMRNLEPNSDRTPPPAVLPGVNADPHIAVFDDTFYIYPTTDGTEGWLSTSFRAWSSRDPILRQSGLVKGAGHHSLVQIPGRDEWVIAYHRFRIPDGNGYNRETCLSPLRHAADGSILPVDVLEGVRSSPVNEP